MSLPIRIVSIACASALAWTAAAADPAGSSSEPSSTSSTSSKPPATADTRAESALAAKPEKPMPLSLHEIEVDGGVFSTLSAYLVNPP